MITPPNYPKDGHEFSWVSRRMKLNNWYLPGIVSLEYSTEVDAADVYGQGTQILGDTRGVVKHSASAEVLERDFDAFIRTLGANGVGFMEPKFQLTNSFAERGLPTVTDILTVRITKVDKAGSQGSDKATVKLAFKVFDIVYDRNARALYPDLAPIPAF